MIYIIIARDTITDNEWVLSETFDRAIDASDKCNYLNTTTSDNEVYRVDCVGEKTYTKLKLSSEYGKQYNTQERAEILKKLASEPQIIYADTDSMQVRREDFTKDELFGGDVADIAATSFVCIECGALVRHAKTHVTWHNKLLP